MANPEIIELPANQWTKVATAVTGGNLCFDSLAHCTFFHTYRVTGESAPADREGQVPVIAPDTVLIDSGEEIDAYVYCFSSNDTDGRVRVSV